MAKVHVGPIYTGVGSWTSFNTSNTNYSSYNKLSSDIYLNYNGWSGFICVPLQYVVASTEKMQVSTDNSTKEKDTIIYQKNNQAFSGGDFNFYIGRKILPSIQLRLGMALPLWYSTQKGVWLGAKSIVAKTEIGFSGSFFSSKVWRYGGEVAFKYTIAGFPQIEDSWEKNGSWSIDGSIKIVNRSIKKWDFGIECLGGYKKVYARWLKSKNFQGYQLSTSFVPHVFANYDVAKRMYLSTKAGFGPSFKREIKRNDDDEWTHSSNSLNVGFGLGFYP